MDLAERTAIITDLPADLKICWGNLLDIIAALRQFASPTRALAKARKMTLSDDLDQSWIGILCLQSLDATRETSNFLIGSIPEGALSILHLSRMALLCHWKDAYGEQMADQLPPQERRLLNGALALLDRATFDLETVLAQPPSLVLVQTTT